MRRFQAIADRFAGKVAIDDGTTRMTYAQIRGAVNRLASSILAATPPSAPIAAILDNTAAFPIVFLACLMTGRPIIPVDTSYPAERQQAILQECGAAAIILGAGLTSPADVSESLPVIDGSLITAVSLADHPETPEPTIAG